jgi:hypothetical protein
MGRHTVYFSLIFSAGQEVSCYDLFPELKPGFEHRGVVYIPALGPYTLISTATLHPQYVRVCTVHHRAVTLNFVSHEVWEKNLPVHEDVEWENS